MRVITSEEVEEQLGITPEQLDAWEREATDGDLHGEPRGEVVVGHPRLFGEETKQVGPVSL